jgi:hypothetical protein
MRFNQMLDDRQSQTQARVCPHSPAFAWLPGGSAGSVLPGC